MKSKILGKPSIGKFISALALATFLPILKLVPILFVNSSFSIGAMMTAVMVGVVLVLLLQFALAFVYSFVYPVDGYQWGIVLSLPMFIISLAMQDSTDLIGMILASIAGAVVGSLLGANSERKKLVVETALPIRDKQD